MIAAILLAAAAAQGAPQAAVAPAPSASPCVALCDAERLRPFLDALPRARTSGRPLRIVQIGDSHTAGDQLTGAWRTLLQARYGGAGRGMLAVGRPYDGYLTQDVTASQSAGWAVSGIFGKAYGGSGSVPLGLSGYSVTSTAPGATLSLVADTPQQGFDRFVLCGWQRPGAGMVRVTAGTTSVEWSMDGAAGPACRALVTPSPVAAADVQLLSGTVTLSSWSAERRTGGVVLSNLGTVGAQLVHVERTDDRLFAAELAEAAPDLIVVAFGTNEAFKPGFSAATYDADLQRGLRRIRRMAPGVPMLLLGAPDTATTRSELMAGPGGAVSSCPGSSWAPPAALASVQAIQRRRAHDLGIAYWDWGLRMGGRCTADDWSRATPPRMRGDRVHFTRTGAVEIVRLLQRDLDAAAAVEATAPTTQPATGPLREPVMGPRR